MEYQQLAKGYRYGLQKIYEMVINNDPCYAYLLRCNQLVDQKLVMAHVYGHNDFFKNNIWFSQTNRKMMDETANHGNRIRSYMERYGEDTVESFIDSCLSLENLIDIYSPLIKRRDAINRYDFAAQRGRAGRTGLEVPEQGLHGLVRQPARRSSRKRPASGKPTKEKAKPQSFPEQPERDVLLFLLEHAPLKPWQHDVLAIIREEAYYFAPQGQTKIMNEGWASFWHSTIMTQKILHPSELVDYADHHSGTMATQPGRLNPYKLGIELLRDIEERWNKGQFGPEWEECDNYETRRKWDKSAWPGPAEDLRGSPHSQRCDVHRHVPDRRLLPPSSALQLQAQRSERHLRDREPRVQEDQGAAAVQPDQFRSADHPGQGRQLPQPRRALSASRALRRRSEARLRAGHTPSSPPPLDPSGAYRDGRSMGGPRCCRLMGPITQSARWEVHRMNPSRKIAAALDENTRAYVLPCSVTVEDGPNRFTLNLTALDSVGVAFDNLDFVTTDRQDWSSDALNAWGERLAGRVTYLLEPLKVLEIDAGGGEVQIRSKSPSVLARPARLLRGPAVQAGNAAHGALCRR